MIPILLIPLALALIPLIGSVVDGRKIRKQERDEHFKQLIREVLNEIPKA